jgi:hypothetical protein
LGKFLSEVGWLTGAVAEQSEKDFSGCKMPRQAKSSLETKSLRFCLIFIIIKTTSLGLKHPPNSRIMTWLVFIILPWHGL